MTSSPGMSTAQMAIFERHPVGHGLVASGALSTMRFALAADHQLGQFHGVGVLLGRCVVAASLPSRRMVMASAAAITSSRRWVMKIMAMPLGGDLLHHADQLIGFGFGEHGGRLVEYQQLDALFVDFTRDLYELHVAYGQTASPGVYSSMDMPTLVERLARVLRHGLHIQAFQVLAEARG